MKNRSQAHSASGGGTHTRTRTHRDDSNLAPVTMFRMRSSLSSYHTTSISKHYALNQQILAAFESHFENKLYQVAYAIGLKFVETALLEIPKHGYFYSQRHDKERIQSSLDAIRVCHLLLQIINGTTTATTITDQGIGPNERQKVEALQHLAMEQCEKTSHAHYESERVSVQAQLDEMYLRSSADTTNTAAPPPNRENNSPLKAPPIFTSRVSWDNTIPKTAACGDSFTNLFGSSTNVTRSHACLLDDDDTNAEMNANSFGYIAPAAPRRNQRNSNVPKQSEPLSDTELMLRSGQVATGVPRMVNCSTVIPPQSNESNPLRQDDFDLQRALFLSGLDVAQRTSRSNVVDSTSKSTIPQNISYKNGNTATQPSRSSMRNESQEELTMMERESSGVMGGISIETLIQCYHEDFDSLRDMNRVRITTISTFQGRVPGSINGCTIIAPLLCIHHFHNESTVPDQGLPDQIIVEVIDKETPNILATVRNNLGLQHNAFIIPSDAHDSLIEQAYLCQEQFVTVCGGDILDDLHLRPLLDGIAKFENKKIAATVFFHEHVIAILKLKQSVDDATKVWFDIIDSLPHTKTFARFGNGGRSRHNRASMNRSRPSMDGGMRFGNRQASTQTDTFHYEEPNSANAAPDTKTVRIRCIDQESLAMTLKWYACSIFTEENKQYINMYKWDDHNSDFDPRIFQAFVWREA